MIPGEDPDNQAQRMVLNYIRNNPGSSISNISHTLDMNQGTIRYHLKVLEKSGLIRSTLRDGRRFYFTCLILDFIDGSGNMPNDLTRSQKRILTLIRSHPGITRSELMDKSSDSKVKVNRSLEKLLSRNLIRRSQNGSEMGFQIITHEIIINEMLLALVADLVDGKLDEYSFIRMREELLKIKENSQKDS